MLINIICIVALAVIVISVVCRIAGVKGFKKAMPIFVALGLAVLVGANCIAIIPTGYTGIRTTFGQVDQMTVPTGVSKKLPFIQSITLVNNKQQDVSMGENQVWGETAEKVPVYSQNATIAYRLSTEKSAYLYSNFKTTSDLITESMYASAFKRAAVTYSAAQVTERSKIEKSTKEELQKLVDEKYGAETVYIIQVVINGMDFEDTYNSAINDKNIAKQQAEQQAIVNDKNIAKAEADANVARTTAQGAADAAKIEAQGKANANALVSGSVTPNTLQQDMLNKWDGKLPTVVGADGMNGLFDISSAIGGAKTNVPPTTEPTK